MAVRSGRLAHVQVPSSIGKLGGAFEATGDSLLDTVAVFEDWLADLSLLDEPQVSTAEGTLPGTPEEVIANALIGAEESLANVRSPLDAEIWGSETLGLLTLPGIDLAEAADLVADLIVPMAQSAGTPTALAMLVALGGVGGGPRLPSAAGDARRCLAEAGVPVPVWAQSLGTPAIGPCWVYGDCFGEQVSVTVTFAYGRKLHALCVLIDNNLGGGVKDSYINVRVPTLRRRMFEMAGDESSTFCEEVTPEYAADRLHAAMAELECPQLPDQLRSVTMRRALLHSRVRLMHGSLS